MSKRSIFYTCLVLANLGAWCMLGFPERSIQADQNIQEPFANSVAQRNEMIEQLRAIVTELSDQNALLRSGQLEVIAKPPSD